MNDTNNEYITNLYKSDEYIKQNPSLHEEDSPWKVSKIIPLLDKFTKCINKEEVNILDVGGGAGIILNSISHYMQSKLHKQVNKSVLDLSPGMLEIQKKNNPDIKMAFCEDIKKTSCKDKEIDLVLMIDVLEHVPNPIEALKEIKRISNYVIFKVPLDGYLIGSIWNFIKRGEPRRQGIQSVGHINIYKFGGLRNQIGNNTGQILDCYFTNVHEYTLNSQYCKNTQSKKGRLLSIVGTFAFKISPKWTAYIFNDFAMFLVKCD